MGTINKRPRVQIDDPGPVHRNEPVTFKATITDPNDKIDKLDVKWYVGGTIEEAKNSEALFCESESQTECKYTVPAQKRTELWLVVRVTDPYSATVDATQQITIQNLAPQADIALIEPSMSLVMQSYDLHTGFIFSGEASKDPEGDILDFTWTVTVDGNKTTACAENKTKRCSFTAEIPGSYEVSLEVADTDKATATYKRSMIVAEDSPPCIKVNGNGNNTSFSPQSLQPKLSAEDPNILVVNSVSDDGNPYPSKKGSTLGKFTWAYRYGTTGTFWRFFDLTSNQLEIRANSYHAGDIVQFRAEYMDTGQPRTTCEASVTCCSLDHECCQSKGDNCDCAQWITWTVTFQ
jgi:hypothetical protein